MAWRLMSVISLVQLKWVCRQTSLDSLRPVSTSSHRVSVQAVSVRSFMGITAGPLLAIRTRRMWGMSSSTVRISRRRRAGSM